jgi:riboflavin synthase
MRAQRYAKYSNNEILKAFTEIWRMFTGIIESTGIIQSVSANGSNLSFVITSSLSNELKVDQSLSHDGVCLTIEKVEAGSYQVTAIEETLNKTNLKQWRSGSIVNLERCMQMNGRIDGHLVQGHVDCTAVCKNVVEKNGSYEYSFSFPQKFAALLIEKGSIAINGISLTAFNVSKDQFTVAIIPYTFEHTNINSIKVDSIVNLEFDMIGKYVNRIDTLR